MSARSLNRLRMWQRLLMAGLLFACTLGVAAPAAADTLDDFIDIYKKIEQVAPAGALPVKSADFVASKGLFNCLANSNTDPVVCVNDFHDTPLGKKAADGASIPTTFWQVVDAYIAYIQNDYWGVAYHMGEAAVCAVVQVLLGGVDACSIIKELVELAKSLYDAGKAVVEFLKDVGGTAKDVATCIITLGGDCGDDSPPTPDEQFVYEYVFLPKIADGVTKIEQANGSYGPYVTSLVNNAKHKPTPILSKPWPYGEDGTFGAKTFLYPHFTAKAIDTARQIYEKAVDANWSKHITQQVLPQLGTERFQYAQNQTQSVAQQAAQGYVNKKFGSPEAAVKFICYDHFTKALPYAHVDQWILTHAAVASKLKAETHTNWCGQEFWGQKAMFAKSFHDYIKTTNLCQESGGSLICQHLDSYQKCLGLMGSVYQQQQCGLNVQSIGYEVALQIKAYFASKGSTHDCPIVKSTSTNAPTVLDCHRPAQLYHCNKYYDSYLGPKGSTPIPVKVLECKLTVSSDYQAKEDKLWKQTVPALIKTHPMLTNSVPPDYQKLFDPLVVGVSADLYSELDADAKKYELDKKTVMSWEPSIDGVEVPTLAANMGSALMNQMNTIPVDSIKNKLGGVNPPDPAGKLSVGKMAIESGSLTTVPAPQALENAKDKAGGQSAKPAAGANLAAKPLGAAGVLPGAAGAPTKTLSGELPPGFGAAGSKLGSGQAQAVAPIIVQSSPPDITSDPNIRIGLQTALWGSTVAVDASKARRQNNGICEFAIQHVARNQGKTSSAAFSRQWTNRNVPGSWVMDYSPIPAGGAVERVDTLPLKPGMNELHLNLDYTSKVVELTETNNKFQVNINVIGNCGAGMARQPPVTGGHPGVPSRPGALTR
jgi:hypothetical protein